MAKLILAVLTLISTQVLAQPVERDIGDLSKYNKCWIKTTLAAVILQCDDTTIRSAVCLGHLKCGAQAMQEASDLLIQNGFEEPVKFTNHYWVQNNPKFVAYPREQFLERANSCAIKVTAAFPFKGSVRLSCDSYHITTVTSYSTAAESKKLGETLTNAGLRLILRDGPNSFYRRGN